MTTLLYIAAPYTKRDPVVNTQAVIRVGTILIEQTSWVPFVPHLTLLWHMVTPRPIGFWYKLDLAYIERCDALVRLPGTSTGADAELRHAKRNKLKIVSFYDLPLEAQRTWSRRGT